jgi:hypothetical protein
MELLFAKERDDRHYGQTGAVCGFEHGGIGRAGDEAVLIDGIPGRHQQIDLGFMGQERANGVGVVCEVKQRGWLGS